MSRPNPAVRHSTVADLELLAAGHSYPVAQVAPDFLILDSPNEIPAGAATLVIRAVGRELRREIDLPDGAHRSSTHVRIVRKSQNPM